METGKISVSRDVVFCEDMFPFASSNPAPTVLDIFDSSPPPVAVDDDFQSDHKSL